MRLKSIEMQGFKSFADKIYLDFNPGITCIVGPNGSGKSNISDAIRWVMGEQSVKSLRGSKMEDVIFAGTEVRKAVGFAEVTLVLDNEDGFFALDFPEIIVTRRVYRSGEGEYYINKTLCRLKDIHELFMDTGLGRDGYSIIGQGKVESILSSKSEDRRQIFEEAAGISKYKYRKLEAERKLIQTTDNLTRVTDILSELETQLEPLKRQSEKAKKYLNLRDELKGLDIRVSMITAEKIKQDLKGLDANIDILIGQVSALKEEIEKNEAEISGRYERLQILEEQMEKNREQDRLLVDKLHILENQTSLYQSDIAHNEQNANRLKEEIAGGKEDAQQMQEALEDALQTLRKLQTQRDAVLASIADAEEKAELAGQDVSQKGSALEKLKTDIIETASRISNAENSLSNLSILKGSFEKRANAIAVDQKDRDTQKIMLENQQALLAEKITAQNKKADEWKDVLNSLEEEYGRLSVESNQLLEMKNQCSLQISRCQSRKHILEDMEREYEGYAKGVRAVMTAYQKKELSGLKIHGPLSQLIQTQERYILAVETALGAANQNIVTDTEEDAKRAIQFLKQRKLGRATFLPISAIRPKKGYVQGAEKYPGYIGMAADLVECRPEFRMIVENFLGTTVLCDQIDHAVAMAKGCGHKFRIVTLGGDVIQPGGAMTGGSAIKTTGSLSRSGEMKKLEDEVKKRTAELEAVSGKISEIKEKNDLCLERIRDGNARMQEISEDLIRLTAEKEHISTRLHSICGDLGQMKKEYFEIQEQLTAIENETEEKEKQIAEDKKMRVAFEEQAALLQNEYALLTGKNDELFTVLTDLNIQRNTYLKDIELQNERIQRLQGDHASLLTASMQKTEEIEDYKKQNEVLNAQIAEAAKEAQEIQNQIQELRENLLLFGEDRKRMEEEIRQRQQEAKSKQEDMFKLTQQQTKLEGRRTRAEEELEATVNRMWEEYELTYSDALEYGKGEEEIFDFKEASGRIKQIKNAMRELGNVNIDAIEEYKSVKERFDFLTEQTNDLEKAKRELEKVIDEMMQIMRIRFAEQFEIINQNFSRVFAELFGGGRANLSLTNPEDILESGIEIEAQPPGKKLQSLTLLSGGERAFTAIALLFAILNVRPTPFCILDEIEAALDDVNVYRYAAYLKQYCDKTQFIVVTHRRGTMEAANILYGVTMQERGISKLLALNIDDIKGE